MDKFQKIEILKIFPTYQFQTLNCIIYNLLNIW